MSDDVERDEDFAADSPAEVEPPRFPDVLVHGHQQVGAA